MFGTHDDSRAATAQRVTSDALHQLAEAFGGGDAGPAGVARQRAGAALDALAGRRPKVRWGWVLAAVGAGFAVGWLAAGVRSVRRTEEEDPRASDVQMSDLETSDVSTGQVY